MAAQVYHSALGAYLTSGKAKNVLTDLLSDITSLQDNLQKAQPILERFPKTAERYGGLHAVLGNLNPAVSTLEKIAASARNSISPKSGGPKNPPLGPDRMDIGPPLQSFITELALIWEEYTGRWPKGYRDSYTGTDRYPDGYQPFINACVPPVMERQDIPIRGVKEAMQQVGDKAKKGSGD